MTKQEQIIQIICKHVEYDNCGKWTVPVLTGDKTELVADEILKLEQKFDIPTIQHVNELFHYLTGYLQAMNSKLDEIIKRNVKT